MTEEQKQALIEDCQRDILDLERDISRCDAIGTVDYLIHLQSRLERQQIALAALTAQPVKLPLKSNVKMGGDAKTRSLLTGMNMMRKSCADAIRAAGYQVEGE